MAVKPSMKFIATTSDKLDAIEIKAGQLIFCSDTRAIYLDTDKRTSYQAIINVADEEARQAIVSPVQGYYYVRDDNSLWSYFGTWIQMTGQSSSLVFITELPEQGEDNTIYVLDDKMYRWDNENSNFYLVGGGSGSIDWEIYTTI